MDTDGFREKKGGGGCAFTGPAAPASCLLPSAESISDCIMLGRQGPSECTP